MSRVVILGEASPGAIMGSFGHGFRELGWEVEELCIRSRFEAELPPLKRVSQRVLYRRAADRLNAWARDRVEETQPDLVLVIKGQYIHPDGIDRLRAAARGPVVLFHPDDPFTHIHANRPAYGVRVLAHYDACFTFARHLIASFEAVGARGLFLPFARDPTLHLPTPPRDPEFEIAFVGNLDDERVRWLEPLADRSLVVYGSLTLDRIPRGSPLRAVTFRPAVFGRELSEALAGAAISLNVMRLQNKGSHNMRTFESPACGAFTLSEWTPELGELFEDGREMATFRTPEQLRAQVDRWATDDDERRRVADAGWRRVEPETYTRRAQQLVASL